MVKATKEVKEKEIKTAKEIEPSGIGQFAQIEFYTLKFIENVWNISDRYLREEIKNGSLVSHKVGKNYVVLHSDLIEYVKKNKTKEYVKKPKVKE